LFFKPNGCLSVRILLHECRQLSARLLCNHRLLDEIVNLPQLPRLLLLVVFVQLEQHVADEQHT